MLFLCKRHGDSGDIQPYVLTNHLNLIIWLKNKDELKQKQKVNA